MCNFFIKQKTIYFFLISIIFYILLSTSLCFASGIEELEYGMRWKKSFGTEDFDQFHEEMSKQEKKITESLEGNDKSKNVLLASIRIIYADENGLEKTKIFQIPFDDKAFISGTKEVKNNVFVASTNSQYLELIILDRMKDSEKLSEQKLNIISSQILMDAKNRVDAIQNSANTFNVYNEIKNKLFNYGDCLSFNNRSAPTDKQVQDEIEKVTTCLSNLNSYNFLPRAECVAVIDKLKLLKEELLSLKKAKEDTNSIILALKGCADAEQHLMAYLSKHDDEFIIEEKNKVEFIVLHIHSRFDVCRFCSPTLWIELHRENGVLQKLQKKYVKEGKNPFIAIFVSCREELKGEERRKVGNQIFEESIKSQDISKYVYQKVTTHQ